MKVRKENDVKHEQQIKLYLFVILGMNLEDENREDNTRTSSHLKLKHLLRMQDLVQTYLTNLEL